MLQWVAASVGSEDWSCSVLTLRVLSVRVHGDQVVSLWRSHSDSSVSLTIQLSLHKEVSFLLQVHATVRAHKARRVAELVPGFDYSTPVNQPYELRLEFTSQFRIYDHISKRCCSVEELNVLHCGFLQ